MTIPNDWGVPDWLDANAYPQPVGRGRMLVWAWEFLRRNRDYRRFWIDRVAPHIDSDGSFDLSDAWVAAVRKEAEERFGLVPLPSNPALQTTGLTFFKAIMTQEIRPASCFEIKVKATEVGYVFDLTMPLEGQFAQALRAAKDLQTRKLDIKTTKERSDKYVIYLRIIDAEDNFIDQSTVANVLFPTFTNEHPDYQRTQTFRNHRTAALRLRDTDYRLLASLTIRAGDRQINEPVK